MSVQSPLHRLQFLYVNPVQGITNSPLSLATIKRLLGMSDFAFYALIENLGMSTITFFVLTLKKNDHICSDRVRDVRCVIYHIKMKNHAYFSQGMRDFRI